MYFLVFRSIVFGIVVCRLLFYRKLKSTVLVFVTVESITSFVFIFKGFSSTKIKDNEIKVMFGSQGCCSR